MNPFKDNITRTKRLALALLASFLFVSCGGGGGGGNPVAPVDKVEIRQTGLLLTNIGATKQLSAVAYDAQGNVVDVPLNWTSTKTTAISVDGTGKVTAATANGASQIVAEAGGVKSAPLLGVVTAPAAGAILLTDAQIVGEPVETDPNAEPSFNNTYKVVLSGISAPVVGSILINTESKVVAGRVVSVDTAGGQTTVTLGLVSIRELFPNLNINEVIDLSQAPVTFSPKIAAGYDITRSGNTFDFIPKSTAVFATGVTRAARNALAPSPFTLFPFDKCSTSITGLTPGAPLPIQLGAAPAFSITLSPSLDLVYTPANGLERFVVNAEPIFKVEASVSALVAFEGKVECKRELGAIRIPIGGPLSLVVGGLLPFGAGMEVGGKVTVAGVKIGVKNETKATVQIGIVCPAGTNCTFVKSLGNFTNTLTPTIELPSLGQLRVEPSLAAFGYVEVALGNPVLTSLRFDAFKVKAGGKLQGSFAPLITQILDADYKSNYKVSLEAGAGLGTSLDSALRLLGVANLAAPELFNVSLDLAQSPTAIGNVSADLGIFEAGDTVNFIVTLNPTDINFIPGVYNVNAILLVRNSGGSATVVGRADAAPGQTRFAFTASGPGSADEFFAFVVSKLLPLDILALELAQARDTTPPTVSSTSPSGGATGVEVNTAIAATFSEKMDASTIAAATFTVGGVAGAVTYDATNKIATFRPSSGLTKDTTYTATIAKAVKDRAGNAMATPYTWTFTTGKDVTPPTLSFTSPPGGATGVAVNTAIAATFSETMDALTISTATFSVGGVTGTVTYSGTTALFMPSSSLAESTTYAATIAAGVKDAAGNAMANPYTWTFTTDAGTPDTRPVVTDIDGNVYNTVTIGTQVWLKENLKVTRYRNGDPIGTTTPARLDISGQTSPKYQWAYEGNESNVATYGRLYTWYAVNDSRGVCPTGWRVPDAFSSDWWTLAYYVGGDPDLGWSLFWAGGKMKEAGTTHWISPNVANARLADGWIIRDAPADNSSGFTALPGGYRDYADGLPARTFLGIGYGGLWWTTTEYSASIGADYGLGSGSGSLGYAGTSKHNGLSLRCVRD